MDQGWVTEFQPPHILSREFIRDKDLMSNHTQGPGVQVHQNGSFRAEGQNKTAK